MYKVLFLLLLLPCLAAAQQPVVPRDTSFTVHSTYLKVKPNYPFVEKVKPVLPAGVSTKTDIPYSTIGNRNLHLDIFYPTSKSRNAYPGVLLIHGGGWRSGNKSHQVPMAQQLAANGYVAVAVEYRLSLEAPYPAAMHDVKAAVRWMRANAATYGLDTTKIAALGCSSGGQMAALLGTTNGNSRLEGTGGNNSRSSAVQAIVDIDGILAFKHPESKEGEMAGWWLGGSYEENPGNWEEASALTHAGKNTGPTLFINSMHPHYHAGRDEMIQKLSKHKIYTEVHTIPDTPHPFWLLHPWFEPTFQYTLNFLNKTFRKIES
ncbi:alpha/beta hydrolase [Pontibacter qinzhouensis]|uniref:Alpha/beta hydrolase n=1 Tax=Pontibacter qinzhouensis TaxID=2603253 RepID=A0A5C8JIH4_9BACT|nr:alpha/beta hydrolase [Pontibacter qinzhouensis]TXK36524.1 alpha/beta hydrolase [Pontibacter qinzhouensis]